MSTRSNDNGRAYEYITLLKLQDKIAPTRSVFITKNSSFYAALNAWNNTDYTLRAVLEKSADAAADAIIELEPLILDNTECSVELRLQADDAGEQGDVRDILVIRCDIGWEIGLSLKHNHFAVKHSRLAKTLDFGDRWFGIPCSNEYWHTIGPLFEMLEKEKRKGTAWRDLPDKENDVYIPLLEAFMDEVLRSNNTYPDVPRKMVEYLLGEFDFYKVISLDARKLTEIQAYNLRGTLGQDAPSRRAPYQIPIVNLPTRIVSMEFKPGSTNTVELYMDEGWQFSFRIHNASTIVEPSLKFDVQVVGMPAYIFTIESRWH